MNLIERVGSDKDGYWKVHWNALGNKPINAYADKLIKLSKLQMMILEHIKTNPHITYDELAKSLKKGRDTIRLNVNKLKEMNLIERIGSRRTGHWKVKADALQISL